MDSQKTAAVLPISEWENVENFCCMFLSNFNNLLWT